jgi:hypothetical protein
VWILSTRTAILMTELFPNDRRKRRQHWTDRQSDEALLSREGQLGTCSGKALRQASINERAAARPKQLERRQRKVLFDEQINAQPQTRRQCCQIRRTFTTSTFDKRNVLKVLWWRRPEVISDLKPCLTRYRLKHQTMEKIVGAVPISRHSQEPDATGRHNVFWNRSPILALDMLQGPFRKHDSAPARWYRC